jgi:hypothetical protein
MLTLRNAAASLGVSKRSGLGVGVMAAPWMSMDPRCQYRPRKKNGFSREIAAAIFAEAEMGAVRAEHAYNGCHPFLRTLCQPRARQYRR